MARSHIAYKSRLCRLLLSFSSLASVMWTFLQAPLVVADDPATPAFTFSPTPMFDPGERPVCPDIRITTRFSPKVPKAGGHVTVTVKLWASTSSVPASLVVHVPNGLDLVKAPRTKRGEVSFYSVYDDLDDEHMLVWENISLSRTDRKPQVFRFRLKIEECLASNEFELDFLTSLMDGYCLDLIAMPTLTVQPKKGQTSSTLSNANKNKAPAVAGSMEKDSMNAVEAQTTRICSACPSNVASTDTYALILSPGPQSKWVDVDWGAYHITVSGYSLTSTEKTKLKTALQGRSPSPGLKFNNCSPWHLTPDPKIPYPANDAVPSPNFVNRPINISGVWHDGLLLDSGALCNLKQRLTYWAKHVVSPSIRANDTFQKGPAVAASTTRCSVQAGTCPCKNPVHTLIFQPYPYHVTLAKQVTSPANESVYSWNKIVRPDFLGLDGSTRLDWYLWLNKKPSCQCQKCGYCEAERNKNSGFWDKIVPCSQ